MSLLDIQSDNISEILVKDIFRKHFQFWLNRFPEINGIAFDELMDGYTEEDWQFFIDKPNKTYIYWWDDFNKLRLFIHKKGARPNNLDFGYVRYSIHTMHEMIEQYNTGKEVKVDI